MGSQGTSGRWWWWGVVPPRSLPWGGFAPSRRGLGNFFPASHTQRRPQLMRSWVSREARSLHEEYCIRIKMLAGFLP